MIKFINYYKPIGQFRENTLQIYTRAELNSWDPFGNPSLRKIISNKKTDKSHKNME